MHRGCQVSEVLGLGHPEIQKFHLRVCRLPRGTVEEDGPPRYLDL
jgi:hypothetical protein